MGSTFSHSSKKHAVPHVCSPDSCRFQVSHVDGQIRTIVRGPIEINDRSLIFTYTENGTTLKLEWPFDVIRHYGRTTDFLFMIEVGRKSATGPGYFFFKSRQASVVNDCLERHLNKYGETVDHRRKSRHDHRHHQRVLGFHEKEPSRSSLHSSRHEHRHQRSRGFHEKEPSAPSYSSGSFIDGTPSEDSSYTVPVFDGDRAAMGLSGGYVVAVFQHQEHDSSDEANQYDDTEHDYVNQCQPASRSTSNGQIRNPRGMYINVQVEESLPPRPSRISPMSSSGVEYSTVINDLPLGRVLGNDYTNLPSLDTLPPAL